MVAVGMGLLWATYTVMLYGYTLVRGYDITLVQMAKPGTFSATWPPPIAPNTELIPSGKSSTAAGGTSGSDKLAGPIVTLPGQMTIPTGKGSKGTKPPVTGLPGQLPIP